MIVMELWIIMGNEVAFDDLDEDFRGDLMLEIWEIFSHHFLDEEHRLVDLERELISVRISRSDSGSLSRMRSEVRLEVSSSIVRQPVITVVANEVLPRPVSHVGGRVKYESEYRPFLVSWNRLDPVGAVLDEERRWLISAITVMQNENSEKR
jgi:hypothetical protein